MRVWRKDAGAKHYGLHAEPDEQDVAKEPHRCRLVLLIAHVAHQGCLIDVAVLLARAIVFRTPNTMAGGEGFKDALTDLHSYRLLHTIQTTVEDKGLLCSWPMVSAPSGTRKRTGRRQPRIDH